MIAVIQCQGRKQPDAGSLKSASGLKVYFVAHPERAPSDHSLIYARPDDPSDYGPTWRQVLLDYNRQPDNPLRLLPAARLYRDDIYGRLVKRFGMQNIFILSAGWGLIRADFLTPAYDITFSQSARGDDSYKRRRKSDHFADFCMLPADTAEDVVFFGSKEYAPLFCSLTNDSKATRTVFYNTAQPPAAPGCVMRRYSDARRNTNWQFDCANAFLDGTIAP